MADYSQAAQLQNMNVAVIGPTVLVAGQVGYSVVLIAAVLAAAGAVTVTFEDGDGTNRLGPMALGANGSLVLPESQLGWARTGSGQSLSLLLSGVVQVGGSITYRLVPDHYASN